ncbi:MAG: hypothetical protein ABWX74_20620 [Aeromicrobium sp.]
MTVSTFVQGAALAIAQEQQATSAGAGTQEEWLHSRRPALETSFASGRLPVVSRFGAEAFQADAARP